MTQQAVLLGIGGHARACVDVLDSIKTYSISFGGKLELADYIPDTRTLSGAQWDALCAQYSRFILGVGQIYNPDDRRQIVSQVTSRNGSFVSLISPYAYVSPNAAIKEGVFIGHHATVNVHADIGMYAILNTGCIIEHDAVVGNFCHISTGAVLNGGARVGNNVFVGSNAVVLQDITICNDVLVGAGSVVIKDITERGIYVGNPAVKIR